jgi:8-oxo-dGTP pyrophosphatase MutT (NUDIX family)
MFCNNCGCKGHGFRACHEPVTSYGLILIKEPKLPVDPAEVSVLMIRRKDSMSYSEFLQGRYSHDNPEYIKELLSNMTISEIEKLKTSDFESLWTDLWGCGNDYHSKSYRESKEKFESPRIAELIGETVSLFVEPEWGFPKGRRHSRENNMTCAIREFSEETNIPRESYVVCKNLVFQETFQGINKVNYRHIYFLALLRKPDQIDLHQSMTEMQRQEVSCVRWMSLSNCRSLVRPHYKERLTMLESFERCLHTFDLQDNLGVSQG